MVFFGWGERWRGDSRPTRNSLATLANFDLPSGEVFQPSRITFKNTSPNS